MLPSGPVLSSFLLRVAEPELPRSIANESLPFMSMEHIVALVASDPRVAWPTPCLGSLSTWGFCTPESFVSGRQVFVFAPPCEVYLYNLNQRKKRY